MITQISRLKDGGDFSYLTGKSYNGEPLFRIDTKDGKTHVFEKTGVVGWGTLYDFKLKYRLALKKLENIKEDSS